VLEFEAIEDLQQLVEPGPAFLSRGVADERLGNASSRALIADSAASK